MCGYLILLHVQRYHLSPLKPTYLSPLRPIGVCCLHTHTPPLSCSDNHIRDSVIYRENVSVRFGVHYHVCWENVTLSAYKPVQSVNFEMCFTFLPQCPFDGCPWKFATPYKLRRHIKSHTKETPFVVRKGLKYGEKKGVKRGELNGTVLLYTAIDCV